MGSYTFYKTKHYDLARQMCNYWANFIRTGNPNGPDADGTPMPQWDPYTMDAPYGMLFGDQAVFLKVPPSELIQFLVQQYFKRNKVLAGQDGWVCCALGSARSFTYPEAALPIRLGMLRAEKIVSQQVSKRSERYESRKTSSLSRF